MLQFKLHAGAYQSTSKALAMALVLLLSACASKVTHRAPVEDRNSNSARSSANPSPQDTAKSMAGSENAGKPGYYTVKPGDTLLRIALESGQGHRDIARWNALENPNKIEVGQVLRVVAPVGEEAVVAKPVASSKVTSTPLQSQTQSAAKTEPAPAAAAAPAVVPEPQAKLGEDEVSFAWPAKGTVVGAFDESKNRKGVDIGGAAGDPVLAAAEGKVVYAGAGLRGYGNLIILKHNNTYLTAYAHNQSLLVKEDQTVKKGQKIAEMGNSDADSVKLHFEVRKLGKPVDPAQYLPAR
ncbi:MAG: peptidoglycan DD-metalloendopeptidase family protein [Sulfuritalea sp.]|nr:peptidoglycan DD-metalloendopeptidase family protein [Sulfuritalea sp.]